MKTDSNPKQEMNPHPDGNHETSSQLVSMWNDSSEESQKTFLDYLLSEYGISYLKELALKRSSLPANTNVMTVKILKRPTLKKGVEGRYAIMACQRCSDGTKSDPVEIPFSTRAGKFLYCLVLMQCSSLSEGRGFSRSDIHPFNEVQCSILMRLQSVLFGANVKTEKFLSMVRGLSRHAEPTEKNYFSRTKGDTNKVIERALFPNVAPFIIAGNRGDVRTIQAALDVEGSDPDIIECLRQFAASTVAWSR